MKWICFSAWVAIAAMDMCGSLGWLDVGPPSHWWTALLSAFIAIDTLGERST